MRAFAKGNPLRFDVDWAEQSEFFMKYSLVFWCLYQPVDKIIEDLNLDTFIRWGYDDS